MKPLFPLYGCVYAFFFPCSFINAQGTTQCAQKRWHKSMRREKMPQLNAQGKDATTPAHSLCPQTTQQWLPGVLSSNTLQLSTSVHCTVLSSLNLRLHSSIRFILTSITAWEQEQGAEPGNELAAASTQLTIFTHLEVMVTFKVLNSKLNHVQYVVIEETTWKYTSNYLLLHSPGPVEKLLNHDAIDIWNS